MSQKIYLDNNATTALDPRVLQAMMEDYTSLPYNPSSIHFFGQQAKNLLTKARRSIADVIGCRGDEIIFTSGGTEANNFLINGILGSCSKGHIITSDLEHSSIDALLKKMDCFDISYLKGGERGSVLCESVEAAIRPDTKLIVLIAANNETGIKSDIENIARLAEKCKIPFIIDAVAWFGKEDFRLPKGVSGMSISGHKIHAPKGIGLAYINKKMDWKPLLIGGGQEAEFRGGTENLAGILGLAKAITLLPELLPTFKLRMQELRDRLEKGILDRLDGVRINGEGERICNTSNLAFEDIDGEALFMSLDLSGIAVSHGSACSTGSLEPSRVLLNMGLSYSLARSSLRFSLSRQTTKEEIDYCIEQIISSVQEQRNICCH